MHFMHICIWYLQKCHEIVCVVLDAIKKSEKLIPCIVLLEVLWNI